MILVVEADQHLVGERHAQPLDLTPIARAGSSEDVHVVAALGRGPDADRVVAVFNENNARLRELLFAVIPKIGPQPEDTCSTALTRARL